MAFNEKLADQVRKLLGDASGLAEKKMFGGLAFLINGNMSETGIYDFFKRVTETAKKPR